MSMSISEFTSADYDDVVALWRAVEGVVLSAADSRDAITDYLKRNPALSFVAREEGVLVGAVLCGHDGRRGYLHHLAVTPSHRRRGLGRQLMRRCLAGLAALGLEKCHLFVLRDNVAGVRFWRGAGWTPRDDVCMLSYRLPTSG
jgi:ribosomal protein S18 acetylase RimI-like enzyme